MLNSKEIKVEVPDSIEALEHPQCEETTYTMSLIRLKDRPEEVDMNAG